MKTRDAGTTAATSDEPTSPRASLVANTRAAALTPPGTCFGVSAVRSAAWADRRHSLPYESGCLGGFELRLHCLSEGERRR